MNVETLLRALEAEQALCLKACADWCEENDLGAQARAYRWIVGCRYEPMHVRSGWGWVMDRSPGADDRMCALPETVFRALPKADLWVAWRGYQPKVYYTLHRAYDALALAYVAGVI